MDAHTDINDGVTPVDDRRGSLRLIALLAVVMGACCAVGCATPAQGRIPPTSAGEQQATPAPTAKKHAASGLAGVVGAVPPGRRKPVKVAVPSSGVHILLPTPHLSAYPTMTEALAVNVGYYVLRGLGTGINFAVAGVQAVGALMVAGVRATVQELQLALQRTTSFVVLHQLFRNRALPKPRRAGQSRRFTLELENHRPVSISWTLVRRVPAGAIWKLDVSNATSAYSVLGLACASRGGTFYRLDIAASLQNGPGDSTDDVARRLARAGLPCSIRGDAPPGAGASPTNDAADEDDSIGMSLDTKAGLLQVHADRALGHVFALPALPAPLDDLCRTGTVRFVQLDTAQAHQTLRQTFVCGYGPPHLIRVEQRAPDGGVAMRLSTAHAATRPAHSQRH